MNLEWKQREGYREATLLGPGFRDGVSFVLSFHPTCYRRGPWRLLVEVMPGEHHHDWGCFDGQDQPLRYYHSEANALDEAIRIAEVLRNDRLSAGLGSIPVSP